MFSASHLLLERRGDESPQLQQTVVDSVSASFLNDLSERHSNMNKRNTNTNRLLQ